MSITTYAEFEQGTELWHLARLGLPTTSNFKIIMSKGTRDTSSATRQGYIDNLAAELYTGMPTEGYKNAAMMRGNEWEPDAMLAYELQSDSPVDHVAFIRNNEFMCGCSPDALIGKDGGVEVKTLRQGLMVALQCNPSVPPQHMAQIQGAMLVTGRQWWDFVAYSPHFDLYVERVQRDEHFIDEIKRYLTQFHTELDARVFKLTKEEKTTKYLRKVLDERLIERIAESQEPTLDQQFMEALEKAD